MGRAGKPCKSRKRRTTPRKRTSQKPSSRKRSSRKTITEEEARKLYDFEGGKNADALANEVRLANGEILRLCYFLKKETKLRKRHGKWTGEEFERQEMFFWGGRMVKKNGITYFAAITFACGLRLILPDLYLLPTNVYSFEKYVKKYTKKA
jgi:hypothetical protein